MPTASEIDFEGAGDILEGAGDILEGVGVSVCPHLEYVRHSRIIKGRRLLIPVY